MISYKPFNVTPKAKRRYTAVINQKAYRAIIGIVIMLKVEASTAITVTTATISVIRKMIFVGAPTLSPFVKIITKLYYRIYFKYFNKAEIYNSKMFLLFCIRI
jgi:hypothetical protein